MRNDRAYRLIYLFPALALAGCDTDEASQVTATSARLNIKDPVTDCSTSNPCKWHYEISSSRATFEQSPGVPTASTSDNVPSVPKVWDGGPTIPDPSEVKTGLTPNTRYYFRACAARGTGPFYCGTVKSFVTMEGLKLFANGSRFGLDVSGTEIIPFGYTYHQMDAAGAEVLRITRWNMDQFASDVDEMKQAGANTIRIRPQIGELMSGPATLDAAGVTRLLAVLDVLERKNVYVDIVGLADYALEPTTWYETLGEAQRHQAQEFFWTQIAAAVKASPAVFALNLINEPLVPATPQDSWRFGRLGDYWFCNYLVKDAAGRTEADVLQAWLRRMSTAVRSVNTRHLITFGAWHQWHTHASWMKQHIDFFEPHLYPEPDAPSANVPASIANLAAWASHGRPVFLGETSSYRSGSRQQVRFVKSIRPHVKGVLSHYYSTAAPSVNCAGDILCAIRQIELADMGDVAPFFKALTTAGRKTALRRFVNVTPVAGRHLHSDSAAPSVDRDLVQRSVPDAADVCKAAWVPAVPYQYSPEADAGVVLKVAEPNTAALERFWNGTAKVGIYLKDPTEIEFAYLKTLGYCYDRLVGFVHKTQVSGTVPLYKCTSTNDEILQKPVVCPSGYQRSVEPLGYVF
jgi:hypothetical protein